jgi:nucleotide-binding universal stress UspA family protein
MKILVATDLSPRSDRAIARGYALAHERHAELAIMHVVDADLPTEFRNHAIEWARGALAREVEANAAKSGVTAALDVFAGHAKTDIARQADAIKADLVVLGIHNQGAQPTPRSFAATTAGEIVKSTRRPVLLVKRAAEQAYGQVVIGIDFSVYSRAALRAAVKLAGGAQFTLVHAFHQSFKGFLGSAETATEVALDQRLAFDAFLEDEMDLMEKHSLEAGIAAERITKIVREGEPQRLLAEECTRLEADLLVVGTHGRTGMSAAIWGSVATDILNNPPADVLVVKAF